MGRMRLSILGRRRHRCEPPGSMLTTVVGGGPGERSRCSRLLQQLLIRAQRLWMSRIFLSNEVVDCPGGLERRGIQALDASDESLSQSDRRCLLGLGRGNWEQGLRRLIKRVATCRARIDGGLGQRGVLEGACVWKQGPATYECQQWNPFARYKIIFAWARRCHRPTPHDGTRGSTRILYPIVCPSLNDARIKCPP